MWKSGDSAHSSVTSRGFVLVIAAILSRVQFHTNLLAPHCVKRRCMVSSSPQVLHRFVSERLIAASPVYPASQFALGFIRASGRYVSHVQGILADVGEFARYSTYFRGFSTTSVRFHVRRKAAVAEVFCAANVLILPRRSARHFRATSGNAHPP